MCLAKSMRDRWASALRSAKRLNDALAGRRVLVRVPECDANHDGVIEAFYDCVHSLETLPLPADEFALLRARLVASLGYYCRHERNVARYEAVQFVRRLRRISWTAI